MKNIGIGLTFLVLALGLGSCTYSAPVEKSMVAVWATDNQTDTQEEPLAYGLVVGDGTQILTVLYFEDDVPHDLFVGVPGKQRYPVTLQVLDDSNHVALLKMDKKEFPSAATPKERESPWGTTLILHGWSTDNFNTMDRREIVFPVYGGSGQMKNELGPYNDSPGALITTHDGKVIGLLGVVRTSNDPMTVILGGPGSTGPMVTIQDALLILSQVSNK